MSESSIEIINASVKYNQVLLFNELNLTITPQKWLAIIGASGVGKTTLLRYIAGLLDKTHIIKGTIRTDGIANHRPTISYLSQSGALFPWLTVLQNIMVQTRLTNLKRREVETLRVRAERLLQTIGLAHKSACYPHELSGGMRQRVALLRTLMQDSNLILMDEPFNGLDIRTRYELQNLACDLLRGKSVLFITHDPAEALRLGHDIYLMYGQPAKLKQLLAVACEIPRDLSTKDMQLKQTKLVNELLHDG